MTRKDRCTFFSLPAENEPAFLFPKSFYILLQNSSEKFFNFFEKTCQECVSEDIYRMKGSRSPARRRRGIARGAGPAKSRAPAVLPQPFRRGTARKFPCAAGLFPTGSAGAVFILASGSSIPPGSFPLRSALRRRRTGSHPLHSLPDRWRETDRRWRPPAARRCGRAEWAR